MEKATTEEIRLILKMISRGYKVPKVIHDVIFEVAKREIEEAERVVLYKRDPNIHSRRIQGAYVKIIDGETIDINPLACGGFGADFDGDSIFGYVTVFTRHNLKYKPVRLHISEFKDKFNCIFDREWTRENGVLVKNYKVPGYVYCHAIDIETGDIKYKRITDWSIHENLNMYSINRTSKNTLIGDIKELWVSENHSIVAIDQEIKQIIKADSKNIINNPKRYSLIKNNKRSISTDDNYQRKILKEDLVGRINDCKFGYFIGALLGDGDISGYRLVLHTSYKELGHAWANIFDGLIEKSLGDCARREVSNNSNSPKTLRDKNNDGYKRAYIWGYRGKKNTGVNLRGFGDHCDNKHLPEWVINSTDDFGIGLFAGYVDTDGMVAKKEISVESKSKQLLDDFRFLLYHRFGIETSISKDNKDYNIGGNEQTQIENEEDYRKYWVMHLPIKKDYSDFLYNIYELLNNPEKKRKLKEYTDICQSKQSTKRVLWVPKQILNHRDFNKGITEGVTGDIRHTIKENSYTQKQITIPDYIINESDIPESFKTLLRKQNAKEIEIIPASCLDIAHDPEKTTGYDFTVEDYMTFTTDTGIFLYDTMAVFAPMSEEAQAEIKKKMVTVNNTTKIGETNFFLEKDMVLGIFILTAEQVNTPIKKISKLEDVFNLHPGQMIEISYKGKLVKTRAGRIVFNELLPKWHPFIDENVNKKKLTAIMAGILKHNESDYASTIDKVKDAGFKYATIYPKSLDLELLKTPKELIPLRDKLSQAKTVSEQSDILNEIDKKFAEHLEKERNDLYYIVESGSSKGILQPRQIVVCKGLVSDPEGNVLPPITKAMNDGYTPKEYFDASAGSRKGTADRAINTGNGGYAYRKMVFVTGNVQADKDNVECYTQRTLNMKLTDDLYKRMDGRNVVVDNEIIPIDKSMIGHVVQLRSPIFCKTKKICKNCYGKLIDQVNSENVGLVAVQEVASLSEKIMKSSIGSITYGNMQYTMEDLWESIKTRAVKTENLETKIFEDKIQGKDGLVNTRIMQKHNPTDKMLFISTRSGHTLICQANHPLWIKKTSMHTKYNNKTCRLSGNEEYKSWGSGDSTIFNLTNSEVIEKEAKAVQRFDAIWIDNTFPMSNENNIVPELNGYIVGFFCGDGSRHYDKEDVKVFRISKDEGIIRNRIIKESFQFESITLLPRDIEYKDPDGKMKNIVWGKRAWRKHLEPNFINYDKEWLRDFLAGYIDTDGTVLEGNGSKSGGTCCRIYTSSYNMVQQLKMICLKLNYQMNTTIVPKTKEGGKSAEQRRVHFSCDIRFYPDSLPINSEKIKRYGTIKPIVYKPNERPTKGFDIITTIKEIWKWDYPVYDISTDTNEFLLGCVQNHNSFHLGGAVIMQKTDIIKELMGNIDDTMESVVRKDLKQLNEDLLSNTEDAVMISIQKAVFESSDGIKETQDSYSLPVGFFTIMLPDFDIKVMIERPVKVYKSAEIEENRDHILITYSKDDKMFYVGSKQENFSDLARYLDTLVGGEYPKSDIVSIYNKFYKALAPVGGWDSVHLEVILSNILRSKKDPQKPARLVEPFEYDMYSIKTLPNLISYPLGLAFENFSKGIQYGMISERALESQIEKVMFGIPLTKEGKK